MIAVLHEPEHLTEASNALMGLGFMFPNLYRKHWMEGLEPEPEWRAYLGGSRRSGALQSAAAVEQRHGARRARAVLSLPGVRRRARGDPWT